MNLNLNLNCSHFSPQVKLFFVEKGKPKTFGFENAIMERGIKKKSYFLYTLKCVPNFRENNSEAPVISKRLKLP